MTGRPHQPEQARENARNAGLKSANEDLKALIRSLTEELNEEESYEDMVLSTLAKMGIQKVTDLWAQFAGSGKDSRIVGLFRHWFEDQSGGHLLTPTAVRVLQHTGPKQRAFERSWMEGKKRQAKENEEKRKVADARAKKKLEKRRAAAAAGHAAPHGRETEKKEGGPNLENTASEVP